jgi:DNA polymerase III alpha subunit
LANVAISILSLGVRNIRSIRCRPEKRGKNICASFATRVCARATANARERFGTNPAARLRTRRSGKNGFVSYLLIVWDFIHFAKEKGIPVGPGRGSAAGSIVAFVLGITDIDPLQFGLIFERFLNPDRVSPPDIDVDFCEARRGEVLEYVRQKYGERRVAQIITFGKLKAKSVVRDVARVLGWSYRDADRIAKMIPNELNITLDSAVERTRS